MLAFFYNSAVYSSEKIKLYARKTSRKWVSAFLVFLLIFQVIAGVLMPFKISLNPFKIKTQQTKAATATWVGTTTAWATDANWSPSGVPTATSDVIIDGTASAQPVISVGAVTIASLTMSGASTLTLGKDLIVTGNADINNLATLTYTQGVAANLTVNGTLTVYSGGTIICPYTSLTVPNTEGSGRTITAGNIDIQSSGLINADGKGFGYNAGPGKGLYNGYDGGSYGGRGGDYQANGTGPTYGSLINPVSLGSGGSHNAAGGAIIISVTGTVTVNGTLSADGLSGYGGAGSGGTINITAAILTGSGTIRVNGGNTNASGFGSGGGGRISLNSVTADNFSGTLQANGGSDRQRGNAGTIYLNSIKRAALVLGGAGNLSSLRLGTDDTATAYQFGTITIQSGGILEIDGNPSLNSNYGRAATLNVTSLEIQPGGVLKADGLGVNVGPGKGTNTYDGGSYGGKGGDYQSNGGVGSTYGSITNPTSLGSGGWGAYSGGAIIISASGTVTVDGTLSANGKLDGGNQISGSGGTINITAAILTGSGTISANTTSSSVGYGAGGGGRIAITQTTGTAWTPAIQAFGGVPSYHLNAKSAAGTVYLKDANDAVGDGELIIDNNNIATVSGTSTDISSLVTDTAVGDVIIRNAGKLSMASDTALTVSGVWNNTVTGGAALTAGTVTFDAASAKTITPGASNNFYNLTFNNAGGTWTPAAALTASGNLTITSGVLDLAGYNLAVTGTFSNSATLKFFGGETISMPTNNASSIIQYYGASGPYTVKNWTYKNIRFSSSSATTYNLSADLTVGENLTIDANNTFDVTATPYNINIAGNWSNSGIFTPRTSTVTFNGIGQSISGATTFYNLTKNVSSADTLTFANGTIQTISGTMNLQGASGNLLSLRSDSTPTQWNIDPQGARTISYLDVKDSNNINASQILVSGFNITNSGNNTNWLFNTAPVSSFNSVTQKTNGTGKVDISIEVDDADDNDTKAKLEYVAGVGCNFASPLDPTLDEAEGAAADYNDSSGAPSVENDDTYQIGTTATRRIITSSGSNTVTFDWDSAADVPVANGTYCLRLTANDDTVDQTIPDTQTVILDNVDPSGYTVSINQSNINSANQTALSFTFASAEVGASYNYSINDTNGATPAITGSGAIATATDTISSINVSTLDDGTLTLTVYLTDTIGNQGANTTDTVTKDSDLPTITSVSSSKANGSYKAGEVIDMDITFSEAVTSTGNITITLETGDTDRTCVFTITNSTTGTCDYTVQAGDNSADLDATISGTINDQASNTLTNYTSTTSLSINRNLLIDTAAPSNTTLSLVSATINSIIATVSNVTDSGSGLHATPYYFENTTAGTNSGWIASASWISSTLNCSTNYSFRVKTRDALTNESGFANLSISTFNCGGGLPPAAFNPPITPKATIENPQGGFKIFINDNSIQTDNFNVTLKFNAGSDVKRMAISEDRDFKNASQEEYAPIKKWTLSESEGMKTVYVKFYTQYGVASKVINNSIIYRKSVSRNESLVRVANDYKVYLIKNNQKQWIKTSREFISLGYKWSDIAIITPEQMASYPDYSEIINNFQGNSLFFSFSRNLTLGDKGTDVKELQKLLNSKGFIISASGPGSHGNETEMFGSLTKKALIKFQKANNIPSFGFFGPVTRKAINK